MQQIQMTHYSPIAKLLSDIGGGNAFFLMVPVMAGFIGMSIADRPGFAPAMVGGLISLNNGGGFLGGLIGGFLGGYSVVLLKKLFAKLPDSFEGLTCFISIIWNIYYRSINVWIYSRSDCCS